METGQRLLITGVSGFTGGHLCERLASQGYIIKALVRDPSKCERYSRMGVELVKGDLRDPHAVEIAMKGVDVVYHIAALFRQENVSRKDMWDCNLEATRHLLDAAVKEGVKRFVHCSTIGVHGDVKNPPATEESPYAPGDYYQESKTEGELLALEYSAQGKLPIVVFRPGGIYGPRDIRFLKLFKAIQRGRFVMLGSGNILYQLIYIDDLVDGIILCGTKPEAVGNVYVLTGDAPFTLNEFMATIANVLGKDPPRWRIPVWPVYLAGFVCELLCKPFGINPPLYRRRVDFFRKTRSFDISKAKRELGFQPKIDPLTGLTRTAEWYRQEGLL